MEAAFKLAGDVGRDALATGGWAEEVEDLGKEMRPLKSAIALLLAQTKAKVRLFLFFFFSSFNGGPDFVSSLSFADRHPLSLFYDGRSLRYCSSSRRSDSRRVRIRCRPSSDAGSVRPSFSQFRREFPLSNLLIFSNR